MTNGINTRELILQILLEIEEEGKHSHIAIRNALSKYQFLPRQERAFITRVCEGTLEYRILIDYIIDSYSKVSVDKFHMHREDKVQVSLPLPDRPSSHKSLSVDIYEFCSVL